MGRGGNSAQEVGMEESRYLSPTIDDLLDIPTQYEPLDSDGEWLMGGGCYYLAAALKDVFPEGKIGASWYSDHGRRALSHAVFYNPINGRAWDGSGTWDDYIVALSGNDYIEMEEDADPLEMFSSIGLSYNPEAPFSDDRMMDAWLFAERHFLPEKFHAPDYSEED